MIEIPVVFSRQFFLDKEAYIANLPRKSERENKGERAARFQRLMDDNGWIRAELARQLGVSRAWITKVLGRPAVAEFCDEIGERGGHYCSSSPIWAV